MVLALLELALETVILVIVMETVEQIMTRVDVGQKIIVIAIHAR